MERNLWLTCLLGQSISDEEAVALIGDFCADKVGNISRTRRAWLIFEALIVCLDLCIIDLDFDLRRKCNVETRVRSQRLLKRREEQQSQGWVGI